jgi:hypothetical protein
VFGFVDYCGGSSEKYPYSPKNRSQLDYKITVICLDHN